MKDSDKDINTLRNVDEGFDPTVALLDALEKLELVEERCKDLESELEKTQDFFGRQLALLRKQISKLERKPPQPKQVKRADNLREILRANPKGIKASEVARMMCISKSTLSQLLKTMEDVETKKSRIDGRATIIILKPELV